MAIAKTRMQGLLVSVASVAVTLTSGYVAYFAGNTQTTGTAEATTLSGGTLRTTAGDTIINSAGVETLDTLSGSQLTIKGTGTGRLVLDTVANGTGTGFAICMKNSAGTMRVFTINNVTPTARAVVGSECTQ